MVSGIGVKNDKTRNKNETPLTLTFAAFLAVAGGFSAAARPLLFGVAFAGLGSGIFFRGMALLTGGAAAITKSGFGCGCEVDVGL